MNSIQPILGKTKKVLKLIWRHFFTLVNLSIGLTVFIEGPINWKNGLSMTAIAIFLDWAKQFIKLGRNVEVPSSMNDPFNIGTPLHKRQWWNSELYGSTTNLTSTNNRIKYD